MLFFNVQKYIALNDILTNNYITIRSSLKIIKIKEFQLLISKAIAEMEHVTCHISQTLT